MKEKDKPTSWELVVVARSGWYVWMMSYARLDRALEVAARMNEAGDGTEAMVIEGDGQAIILN